MDEILYAKRTKYRELLNKACADFSIYSLHNNIDTEFIELEKQLWRYREESLRALGDDFDEYDKILLKARGLLARKEIFNS